jgi:hypothetical protein
MTLGFLAKIFASCLLLVMLGCGDQVRVAEGELVGAYTTNTNEGKEQLTLNPDRTYLQSYSSPTRQFSNSGSWKPRSKFLGGTEIKLRGANLSADDPLNSEQKHGVLLLQVYRVRGRLKLARNAAADWYTTGLAKPVRQQPDHHWTVSDYSERTALPKATRQKQVRPHMRRVPAANSM